MWKQCVKVKKERHEFAELCFIATTRSKCFPYDLQSLTVVRDFFKELLQFIEVCGHLFMRSSVKVTPQQFHHVEP